MLQQGLCAISCGKGNLARIALQGQLNFKWGRNVIKNVTCILTSTYGKIFDFIVQVVPINVEDNANIEDEQ